MGEAVRLALAFAAGSLLGVMFFGGLWWTIEKGMSSKQPGLWFLGSLLLRTVIALSGFYLIADGQWERLVTCLVGFIVARVIVVRVAGSWGGRSRSQSHVLEGDHAP
jgi:F1F0 ATPase subunit 2